MMTNLCNLASRCFMAVGIPFMMALALAGCGPLVTVYASFGTNDEGNDQTVPPLNADPFLGDMARKFGLMALFADVVYRDDIPENERDGGGCAYLSPNYDKPERLHFGMPRVIPREEGNLSGWKRWVPPTAGNSAISACFDDDGLYYETYVYANQNGELEEAVIAFRGTENRSGQYWSDWRSNFVAALGFEPQQYLLAKDLLPPLIHALSTQLKPDSNGAVRIYAVGHSLGGGLAQQAGYLSKEITAVFTFNTSPVTNWSHLRLARKVRSAYPTIYRLYHGGEALEKVRFVTTSVTEARYGRHDIGLQFQDRTTFKGHSMTIISCNLAMLLAAQNGAPEAAHHYPVSFVKGVVLSNGGGICPVAESPSQ